MVELFGDLRSRDLFEEFLLPKHSRPYALILNGVVQSKERACPDWVEEVFGIVSRITKPLALNPAVEATIVILMPLRQRLGGILLETPQSGLF